MVNFFISLSNLSFNLLLLHIFAYGRIEDIMIVDLSNRTVKREELDESFSRRFLGGMGINTRLAYDFIPKGTDPLSPENSLIMGAGLLGGTLAPSSSKLMGTTKFPYTGRIATAFAGSGGDALAHTGNSHVVIGGEASEPVVVKIQDDKVSFCPARHVWGKDIFETTDQLRSEHGHDFNVIAIGPAGEKLSKISFALVNKMSTLGEGGLGAVMGSKKLKAILIKGEKGKQVADIEGFMRETDALFREMKTLSYRNDWIKIGPLISAWGRSDRRKKKLSGESMDPFGPEVYEGIWQGALACPSCPVACKSKLLLESGEKAGSQSLGTGFGHYWARFNVDNMQQALELRDFCNRQGIEERGAVAVLDFVMKLREEGVLSPADTEGLELRKGFSGVKEFLRCLCQREGFGDVLADGICGVISRTGKGADRYEGIREEASYHDPRRHFMTRTVTAIVNPRGLSSIASLGPSWLPGHPPANFSRYLEKLGLKQEIVERICSKTNVNMAIMARYAEDWYTVQSCLGLCVRQPVSQCYTPAIASRLYKFATGKDISVEELFEAGDRVWNLWKLLTVRDGYTRKDDNFPEKFYQPLVVGKETFLLKDYYGNPLTKGDMEKLLDDYHRERGWNLEDGLPSPEKISSLALDWVKF
ncbi:MAG: hypothetical protein HY730_04805 [Candidatus Tectomicrobia bacterium]|uniref:Aldehyde ferredoxin oxidoreductase N-terminal domain-containing protein n=1 Tax=Tectimicrobiota bacterium TaxID=2528274 RepID=A0A933GMV6_UNCTE|nr:hypothetical protein [Candidatus Tectomicrobia bacterium]